MLKRLFHLRQIRRSAPVPGAETDDLQMVSNNFSTLESADVSAAGTAALRELAAQTEVTEYD